MEPVTCHDRDVLVTIQGGFKYEVRRYLSIPLEWAQLLKDAGKHHYDHRCNAEDDHCVINGLYNPQRWEWKNDDDEKRRDG